MTLVDHVQRILTSAGYRELPRPFAVGGLPFEFSSAFVARERSLDLIVVVDLSTDTEQRFVQKIRALARALDLAKSRRPLTAVLVGAECDEGTVESLSPVCRVLPIGAPAESVVEQVIRDWLAVLLPLPELEELSGIADWETELAAQLPSEISSLDEYKAAANRSAEAVEAELASLIKSQVTPALQENTK
jgi:hypothetical protein